MEPPHPVAPLQMSTRRATWADYNHAMNPPGLQGRVAVVIGGASGVGRGIALAFLAEGARVVVADIDLPGAHAVVDEAARRGAPPDHTLEAEVDSTDRRSLEALAAAVMTRFEAIHLLDRVPGESLGPLVAAAVRANRLFICNRPDALRSAVEQQHRGLSEDLEFLSRDLPGQSPNHE
jgi:NAD(P)-dependent dehydrogenase (short-subunit alcohol dehydrogenase family)